MKSRKHLKPIDHGGVNYKLAISSGTSTRSVENASRARNHISPDGRQSRSLRYKKERRRLIVYASSFDAHRVFKENRRLQLGMGTSC